jgi:hypothetical protein
MEKMWKKEVVALGAIPAFSWKDWGKPLYVHSGYPTARLKFELDTSRVEVQTVTT